MSKWVNADYINDFFDKWEERVKNAEPITIDVVQNVRSILNEAPTIEIVACDECRWSNDCSQLIDNLEHTASTSLRWCSDGIRRAEGEWYRQTTDHFDYWECSECGIGVGIDDIKNFCPNCGADNRPKLAGKHADQIIIDEAVQI